MQSYIQNIQNSWLDCSRYLCIYIYHIDENEELIGIKLYVLGKTNISGKLFPKNGKSLQDAVLAIKDAVTQGKLLVTYTPGGLNVYSIPTSL